MLPVDILPPLVVAGPLAIAGVMLAVSPVLPARVPDVIATITALIAAILCAGMAMHTANGPLITWFGGWIPRPGLTLGIDFSVDEAGAAFSCFIGILFTSSLVFAWGYFDSVHAHFHVLMLLFMAGMIGFCLTHDLFNLFVWFEVMSVAGFALTGYGLRTSALEAALNFTVVNTIGAYLILGGIGLIYAKTGALDFGAISTAIRQIGPDPVITAAFALLASGLLIKAAQVPFHFWLSDAHGVAPSPVSVIFSGAMVSIGLFGVGRLVFSVFDASPAVQFATHTLLLGMGAASAVIGGAMSLVQRHLKRLLAFSTVSHAGIMLIGLALLNHEGLTGMLAYLFGHGLVKGALFMVAGTLLATCGGIDEIGLRGMGKQIWPAGIVMAAGGLLLAGFPLGLMELGSSSLGDGLSSAHMQWLHGAMLLGASLTGGAVLRATGRIFMGWGPVPGEEDRGPTEEDQENADRPLWVMLTPAAFMLFLAVVASMFGADFFSSAATQMMHGAPSAAPTAHGWLSLSWISVIAALGVAAFDLNRRTMPGALRAVGDMMSAPAWKWLEPLHSGLIGDYVAWLAAGVALFAMIFA